MQIIFIMKTKTSLCNIIQTNLRYFSEFALHVFDSIMEAGKDFGIRHCGYYAMHAVRIEKVRSYMLILGFISKYIILNAFIYSSMDYTFFSFMRIGVTIWTVNLLPMNVDEHSEYEWKTKITSTLSWILLEKTPF